MVPLTVIHTPDQSHLDELRRWLTLEYEEEGEGFLCNWSVIERSWQRGELICGLLNQKAVALFAWQRDEATLEMNIVTVQPELRGRGYGRQFVEAVLHYFQGVGVHVAVGECAPERSESFWNLMDFSREPGQRGYGGPRVAKALGRTLVSVAGPVPAGQVQLELWNLELYNIASAPPWKRWCLGRADDRGIVLAEPVVSFAEMQWGAKLTVDGIALWEGNVKWLQRSQQVLHGDYLILRSLDLGDLGP